MKILILGYPDSAGKGEPRVLGLVAARSEARAVMEAPAEGVARKELIILGLPLQVKKTPGIRHAVRPPLVEKTPEEGSVTDEENESPESDGESTSAEVAPDGGASADDSPSPRGELTLPGKPGRKR